MDRVAADAAASDVAVADSRGDTLYRRPVAHPPAEATTGGSWFTEGTELPPVFAEAPPPVPTRSVEPPEYGPATPSGTSRASYGFTAGPISPVRHGPTSAPPAPAGGSWPPPPRLDPDPLEKVSGALRVPSGEHLAGSPLWEPSGEQRVTEHSALRGPSGEQRVTERSALREPSGEQRVTERSALRGPSGEHRVADRAPAETRPPRQSRAVTVGIVLLGVFVLVLGSVAGVLYFSGDDNSLTSVLRLGAGGAKTRTVSAPLDNRDTASFEMLAGVTSVHVTIGELGDDLYRISTPDDSGILPSPTIRDDDVKLQVSRDGDGTGGEIEVVLAAKVRWQLRFSGYAEKQDIDVSGGQIRGIEMVAGAKNVQLTLARPTGTVPLKINGAVDSLVLKSPADNPMRIRLGGGAQTVVAGSRTLKDMAAGSTLTPRGWNTTDRYDVTAGARITALTVDNA